MDLLNTIRKKIEILADNAPASYDIDYVRAIDDVMNILDTLEQKEPTIKCHAGLGAVVGPKPPKIKGWVARDKDATLHFFSSEFGDGEPIYCENCEMWNNATGEKIELLHQSDPFRELKFTDEPIEVELIVRKV